MPLTPSMISSSRSLRPKWDSVPTRSLFGRTGWLCEWKNSPRRLRRNNPGCLRLKFTGARRCWKHEEFLCSTSAWR